MKLTLLITVMFALALAHANNLPCQPARYNNAHNTFLRRHIVRGRFDRRDEKAWAAYIRQNRLCTRNRPNQSFIESAYQRHVVQICNGAGYQVVNGGNLCISLRRFTVYQLRINTNTCEVIRLDENQHPLVVACDRVGNQCLPVHYQWYNNQMRNRMRRCR